jgi:ligand-binding SRPBCC domain-containing protein
LRRFLRLLPLITLTTRIKAPVERVFDLARSIEAHLETTSDTDETVVGGKSAGLLEKGDETTWAGTHLRFKQRLTVQITEMERPEFFIDQMVAGAFTAMSHRHAFEADGDNTIMRDEFDYVSRPNLLGKLIDNIFLTAHLRRFLSERNKALKKLAESDDWHRFLTENEPLRD